MDADGPSKEKEVLNRYDDQNDKTSKNEQK